VRAAAGRADGIPPHGRLRQIRRGGWPKVRLAGRDRSADYTIELRRIAPLLGVHGIFVHSTRGNQGRILSLGRDRKVDQNNGDMRNILAYKKFGREPDTPEGIVPNWAVGA
jgi:hypothetical protein